MKRLLWPFFVIVILLTACSPATPAAAQNGIEVYDARVFLPGGDAMAGMQTSLAGFMVLKNITSGTDRLVGVSADFGEASLHETKMNGDVATMDVIPGVDLPAGQMVELRSGSYHIMVVNLTKEVKSGDQVILTLEFEKAGKINVPAVVTDK